MDVESLVAELPAVNGGMEVSLRVLYEIPDKVRAAQGLFQATGGSHAAALFDERGEVLAMREDLSRHNALDKVIGSAILDGLPMNRLGVFLTGRVTLEMIIKVVRGGIPIAAAVSTASAVAGDVAELAGVTLCGFVRGNEVTVYTHPERIPEAARPTG